MKKLVLALSVIAFTACNNNQQKQDHTGEQSACNRRNDCPAETGNENVITISGGDDMKFDKTELKAKAGETVKLILKHVGKAPIEAMGHNVVILAQGTDFNAFANAAIDAKDNGYIPKGMENAVIAKTDMIGGGQTTEITFTAPVKVRMISCARFPVITSI
jgi:azurin